MGQDDILTIVVNNTIPESSTATSRLRRDSSEQPGAKIGKRTPPEESTSENKSPVARAKPKLSSKSIKFLAQLKSKRKSRARSNLSGRKLPPADQEQGNLTALASYTHEDWVPYSDPPQQQASSHRKQHQRAEPEEQEEAGQVDEQEEGRASQPPEVTEPPTTTTTAAPEGARLKKAPSEASEGAELKGETAEEERPLVSKSTTSSTTIGDGRKSARLSSKSGSLPAGLRRKIIEQFVKAGGDPQNIVVSDSTITTTSQSKKKTITTVYKLVPNTAVKPAPKAMILRGEPDWLAPAKGSPRLVPGSLIGGPRAPNRKLKKIMVTRTETPDEAEQEELRGALTSGGAHKPAELGEFYQGPHETIFGLNERPNEFSPGEKRAILNLDRMVMGMKGAPLSRKPATNKLPDKEIHAELQLGGIGGGGISLKSLIDAIKPSLEIVKMANERSSNVAEHKSPNSAHLTHFREMKEPGKWAARATKSSSATAAQSVDVSAPTKAESKPKRKKPEASPKASRPKPSTTTEQPQTEQSDSSSDEPAEEPTSTERPKAAEKGTEPTQQQQAKRKAAASAQAGSGPKLDSLEQLKRVVGDARQRSREKTEARKREEEKPRRAGSADGQPEGRGAGHSESSKSGAASSPSSSREDAKRAGLTSTTTTTTTPAPSTSVGPSKGKTHNIMMVIDFGPPAAGAGGAGSPAVNNWSQSVGGRPSNQWQPVKAASSQLLKPSLAGAAEPARQPAEQSPGGAGRQPATVNVQIFNQQPAGHGQLSPLESPDYAGDAFDEPEPGFGASARDPALEAKASQLHEQFRLPGGLLGGHFAAVREQPPAQFAAGLHRDQHLALASDSDSFQYGTGQGRSRAQVILPGESADTNRLVTQVIEELAREPPPGRFFTTTRLEDGEQAEPPSAGQDLDTSASGEPPDAPTRQRGPAFQVSNK